MSRRPIVEEVTAPPADDWTWYGGHLTDEQITLLRQIHPDSIPDRIWINGLYEVWMRFMPSVDDPPWPAMIWLSIKRRDKAPIHDWRHLQRIKTECVGPENEAVELYPAESRCVDMANQFHLWVVADPKAQFPFGFRWGRAVHGPEEQAQRFDISDALRAHIAGAVQRPLEDSHDAR